MEVSVRNILVPVSISEASAQVCAYGKLLSERLGAHVTALYVVEDEEPEGLRALTLPALTSEDEIPELEQAALRGLREHVLGHLGEGVSLRVVAGDTAREIVRVAGEIPADLIVMGNHGRKGIEKVLYGNTVEEVLRRASVPVLSVPLAEV